MSFPRGIPLCYVFLTRKYSCVLSLQIQSPGKLRKKDSSGGETPGATSCSGSLTVEAALVLTLVIFSWTALITLFSAMQIHIKLRYAMEQAAEEFAMLAYLTEMVETDVSPEDIGGMVSSYDVGAYLRSVMDEPASSGEVGGWETDWNGVLQAGVTALVLRSRILTLVGRDTLDDS